MGQSLKYTLGIVFIIAVATIAAIFLVVKPEPSPALNYNGTNQYDKSQPSNGRDLPRSEIRNYTSEDFGLSFSYNTSAYKDPIIEKDENGEIQLRLTDNTYEQVMPESPFVLIRKTGYYQNYIDKQIEKMTKDKDYTIVNRDPVDGSPAVRFNYAALGEPTTVLIKHPSGYHLEITGSFPGPYFEDLLKSIQVNK